MSILNAARKAPSLTPIPTPTHTSHPFLKYLESLDELPDLSDLDEDADLSQVASSLLARIASSRKAKPSPQIVPFTGQKKGGASSVNEVSDNKKDYSMKHNSSEGEESDSREQEALAEEEEEDGDAEEEEEEEDEEEEEEEDEEDEDEGDENEATESDVSPSEGSTSSSSDAWISVWVTIHV